MKRVGVVGLGFMGMVHYLTYDKLSGARVVAVAEQDEQKLSGDWTSIKGNFGPAGQQMDLSHLVTTRDYEELLANPDIDLIDITLPPSLHADFAIRALESGKDVFCEKPMAMDVADCQSMVEASRRSGQKLMIGHVLPFFPEYAWALREITAGKHGRVLGGSFKRVISDPAWLPHFWDARKVGGPMLDLHVHDAHFVRYVFGMPRQVTTRGSVRNGLPEHWNSLLEFDDKSLSVHVTSGTINQQGRGFLHGFEIRLEQATLVFEFAVMGDSAEYLCAPTILHGDGSVEQVELGDGDPMLAFQAELSHVIEVVNGNAKPGPLACDLAADAITLCDMQANSLLNHSA